MKDMEFSSFSIYVNVILRFIIPRDGSSYTFSIVLPRGELVNKR